MPILHAIVLGLVQGLSEFLPVSSSGHLVLVPWLLGWTELSANPDLNRTFDVALHLGTFVGALAYFRHDIALYAGAGLRSLRKRAVRSRDERVAWLLVISTLPAVVVGALLESLVEDQLSSKWMIGVMLVVFAVVLGWADGLPGRYGEERFGLRAALIMGGAQAAALQPGVSRSGATISAARWLGFTREAAARLSFLMSLPVIGGAGLYQAAEVLAEGGLPPGLAPAFAWGMAASAVSGFFAVWALLHLVKTRSFRPFVVYRLVVGTAVVAIAASPWR